MSKCEIYFRNKIPLEFNHLIKFIKKDELKEEINKIFPLTIIKDDELENLLNLSNIFYLDFGGFYWKIK